MQIVKIRNTETNELSERDYKSVALAQDTAYRQAKKNQASYEVVVFNLGEPAATFSGARLTKGEAHAIKVAKNAEYRKAVKEQREVEKWERANVRYQKSLEKEAAKANKEAEKEYQAAVREQKEIARWENSNNIYHTRMVAATLREQAEIAKWEEYDRQVKAAEAQEVEITA